MGLSPSRFAEEGKQAMSFTNYYFQSEPVNTGPYALTVIGTAPPRLAGRYRYHLKTTSPALVAGLVFLSVYWKDRDGTQRSHTSAGLSLLSISAVVENEFNVWFEDAETPAVSFEVTPVGVIGSYSYEFWISLEGEQGN